MSDYLKFCPNCRRKVNNDDNIESAYYLYLYDNDYECHKCHEELIDVQITRNDAFIMQHTSDTIGFLEAMIELQEKDPIDYQLKINQFKTQYQQQKAMRRQKNDNIPRCPTCNSTNLSKISTAKKATKIGLFGIFGAGDVGKTWKCNNCGTKW